MLPSTLAVRFRGGKAFVPCRRELSVPGASVGGDIRWSQLERVQGVDHAAATYGLFP